MSTSVLLSLLFFTWLLRLPFLLLSTPFLLHTLSSPFLGFGSEIQGHRLAPLETPESRRCYWTQILKHRRQQRRMGRKGRQNQRQQVSSVLENKKHVTLILCIRSLIWLGCCCNPNHSDDYIEYFVSYHHILSCQQCLSKRLLKLQSNASLMVDSQALRQAGMRDIGVEELFQALFSYAKQAAISSNYVKGSLHPFSSECLHL